MIPSPVPTQAARMPCFQAKLLSFAFSHTPVPVGAVNGTGKRVQREAEGKNLTENLLHCRVAATFRTAKGTWMTNSYLIGHYNFLGILENLCQDLGTVHVYVHVRVHIHVMSMLWRAACSIPTHSTSFTLLKKTIFLLQELSFCDEDVSFQATLLSLRRLFLYFDINSNIVPFLIDICRSWVKFHSCAQPPALLPPLKVLCLELESPLGTALPFPLLFHLGSDFTL